MSMVINTNTASLIAQAAQAKTNSAMETAMERLSTGKRINSASDDAAGMAMASRVESQIRGLTIAVRNAGDASSLLDTAEAAMAEQANMLQRMRELAIQSSNGTNSVADRLAIQDEVSQLRSELDRISSTTSWAGNKLLDGSFTTKKFQVGSGATETVSLSITAQGSADLGVHRYDTIGTAQGSITDGASDKTVTDFDVLGKDGAAEAAFAAGSSAKAVAAAVNADSSSTGVTAQAVTIARISLDAVPAGLVTFSINGGGTATAISETVTSNTDLTNIKNAINAAAGSTGVTADFYGSDKSYLVLTDADGDDIFLTNFSDTGTATNLDVSVGNFDGTSFSSATSVVSAATGVNDAVVNGVVRMESTQAFSISDEETDSTNTTAATGYLGNTNDSASSSATNVSGINVSTEAGARSAISVLDGALEAVNETRSELGATSNRLEYTINNLSSMVTNAGASKSRIEDADFAVETSNLTKAQILSQAATAMLAQANASKQSVLSLLQG